MELELKRIDIDCTARQRKINGGPIKYLGECSNPTGCSCRIIKSSSKYALQNSLERLTLIGVAQATTLPVNFSHHLPFF